MMSDYIKYFQCLLYTAMALYFRQENEYKNIEDIPLPDSGCLLDILDRKNISFDEQVVVMLALMPHLCPQALDILYVNNKNFDRPYTEFGGWRGVSHGGFLPTGETAVFILAGEDFEKRKAISCLFEHHHWFYTDNVLWLEGQGKGEPFLSGRLQVSDEVLSRVLKDKEYKPDFSPDFPAKWITTSLEWDDVVLAYDVLAELEEINMWITGQKQIMNEWGLGRFLKPGYRTLFYGPPGTGKTLTASLIGKRNGMDVYRVDLSMIVSKYIGETEKNLARVFDLAENRNWILFFDEADALFGKRTATDSSNDRHANQEVAYLLQRIEDFPGTVILATNLRSNIDEAFARRFQSVIYFPMPDEEQREELWRKMLPAQWIDEKNAGWLRDIAQYELAGGAIANVIRRCALQLMGAECDRLTKEMLMAAVRKELYKEGKM